MLKLNHKKLDVWKLGIQFALQIYKYTEQFPKTEIYALTSQLQRAAVSIPSNIAEGHSRNTDKEFIQFLYHARGSLEELRYFLLLSKSLGYVTENTFNEYEENAQTVSKMLNSLISSIRQKLNS